MKNILIFLVAVVFIGCSKQQIVPPIQQPVEKQAEPMATNEIFDSFNKRLKFYDDKKAEKDIYEYGYKFFNNGRDK
ncbi:MAG: hypothetical protein QG567_729 [Campylobacterota bacterium]|nr:hypothetical protein [Campylobacterota bacterium]MDQ1339577.1 hypothetical protein [Campylobacterota bacterium]